MEVTRDNFTEVLPRVLQGIEDASFVAFDLEMTGIFNSDKSKNNRKDDLPHRRYENMTGPASKYHIVQVGIVCFRRNSGSGHTASYSASAFNFYIFPEKGPDIIMSPSTIDFLRKNKMDFGKWINKGIPFADAKEEEWLKKRYLEPITDAEEADLIVLTRETDKEFFNRNWANLIEYVEDTTGEVPEYVFERCNTYLQRCIREQVRTRLPPHVLITKTDDGRLKATKMTTQELDAYKAQEKVNKERIFQEKMGFRTIFRKLMNTRVPLVGHNCFFDILFILRWFDAPLENEFDLFRHRLASQLPAIYDTKYIAACGILGQRYEDTTLSKCYQMFVTDRLRDVVSVSFMEGCEINEEKFHDAVWDAYCTGCVYINQLSLVHDESRLTVSCLNRLFMMQSLYFMNLDPNEPHGFIRYDGLILHISNFPPRTNSNDVMAPFLASSIMSEELEILWVDDKGLFVIVNSENITMTETLKKIVRFPGDWIVRSYEEFLGHERKGALEELTHGFVNSLFSIGRTISDSIFGSNDHCDEENSPSKKRKRI